MRSLTHLLGSSAVLMVVFFFIGAGLGYMVPHPVPVSESNEVTRLGGYNYINPLLSCDVQEDTPYSYFDRLRQQLEQQINDAKARGDVVRASVYFRDMNTGHWTGVGENDLYIPASLLKVPVLIAYFYDQETGGSVLNKQYTLPAGPDANAQEYYKPQKPLTPGGTYSVEELLTAMIEQSDNNALAVLNRYVSTSSIDGVYQGFGLPVAPDLTTESISPVEYMRVFRILYNATYLNRADSQKVLGMLSAVDFPQGAVRGLPQGTPFANKFGERTVTTVNISGQVTLEQKQLADCGIVYYPATPYGICIMTEGNDFSKLADIIAGLSKTAYTVVDSGALK